MTKRFSWTLLLVLLLSACAGGQATPDTNIPAAGVVKIYKSPA